MEKLELLTLNLIALHKNLREIVFN